MKNFTVAVAILTFGAVGCQKSTTEDADASLRGNWELVTTEKNGIEQARSAKKVLLKIDGSSFSLTADGVIIAKGSLRTDLTTNPKTIDSTYTEGANKGKTMKGIYVIEGDVLQFCQAAPGGEKPKEFKTSAGDGASLTKYEVQTARTAP